MRATTIEGLNGFARTLCFGFYAGQIDGHVLQYLTSFIFLYPIWLVFTPLLTFVQVILTVELPMGHNVVMSSLVFFLRQTDSQLLCDLSFQPFQGHPRSKYCLELDERSIQYVQFSKLI